MTTTTIIACLAVVMLFAADYITFKLAIGLARKQDRIDEWLAQPGLTKLGSGFRLLWHFKSRR